MRATFRMASASTAHDPETPPRFSCALPDMRAGPPDGSMRHFHPAPSGRSRRTNPAPEGRTDSSERHPPRATRCCRDRNIRAGDKTVALHGLHIAGLPPQNKNVLGPGFLQNLDIRAIRRPNRDRAIHREFHVPCSGSLGSCSRDLFAQVGCRNDLFGHDTR